jgi:hypothetical protein
MSGFIIGNAYEDLCYIQDDSNYLSLIKLFTNYLKDSLYQEDFLLIDVKFLEDTQKRIEIWLDTTLSFRIANPKSKNSFTKEYSYKGNDITIDMKFSKLDLILDFVLEFYNFINLCIRKNTALNLKKSEHWKN